MKGSSDHSDEIPKLKKTDIAGSSSRRPQMMGEGQIFPNSEVEQYLKDLRDSLTQENFVEFLDIMKGYLTERIDFASLKENITNLLEGRQELISGFNANLPVDYRTIVSKEDENKPAEFYIAMEFIHKMKETIAQHLLRSCYVWRLEDTIINLFPQDMHNQVFCLCEKVKKRICNLNHYQEFLKFIKLYHIETISRQEVQSLVYALFGAHRDLMEEVIGLIDHRGKTDGHASRAQNAKDGNSDLEKGYDRDAVKDQPLKEKGKRIRRSVTTGSNLTMGSKPAQLSGKDQREGKPLHKLDLSNNYKGLKRKGDAVKDQPLKGKRPRRSVAGSKLIESSKTAQLSGKDEREAKPLDKPDLSNCEGLKRKRNVVKDTPLKEKGKRTRSVTGSKLIDGSKTAEQLSGKGKRKVKPLQNLNLSNSEGFNRKKNVVKDQPLKEKGKRRRSVTAGSKRTAGSKHARMPVKEQRKAKPLHKLHLSNCESFNPSYRLIPENRPIPEASQRTEMDKQVLNDHWVSFSDGGSNNFLKEPPKSKHEQILDILEDDRMEIEVLLECINVTIKRAEEVIAMIDNKSIETDSPFRVEGYFSGPSLWCIKTLYGKEYGGEMVKLLRKKTYVSLQILLVRLKQKQEEFMNWCSKFKELL